MPQVSYLAYPGPPTSGFHERLDVVVDVNGSVFTCSQGGNPGQWAESQISGVEAVSVVAAGGAALTLPAPATAIGSDITLSANLTVAMPAPARGAYCYAIVRQAASGGPYTVAFTSVKWPGGVAPVMSAAANAVDRHDFMSDGTGWFGVIVGQAFA